MEQKEGSEEAYSAFRPGRRFVDKAKRSDSRFRLMRQMQSPEGGKSGIPMELDAYPNSIYFKQEHREVPARTVLLDYMFASEG